MDLMVQLEALISQKQGYSHSYQLIHFFDQHKDRLTNDQKRQIYIIAENYRTEHNKENTEDEIRREDTYPNIYTDLSFLEEKKSQIPITDKIEEMPTTSVRFSLGYSISKIYTNLYDRMFVKIVRLIRSEK